MTLAALHAPWFLCTPTGRPPHARSPGAQAVISRKLPNSFLPAAAGLLTAFAGAGPTCRRRTLWGGPPTSQGDCTPTEESLGTQGTQKQDFTGTCDPSEANTFISGPAVCIQCSRVNARFRERVHSLGCLAWSEHTSSKTKISRTRTGETASFLRWLTNITSCANSYISPVALLVSKAPRCIFS